MKLKQFTAMSLLILVLAACESRNAQTTYDWNNLNYTDNVIANPSYQQNLTSPGLR